MTGVKGMKHGPLIDRLWPRVRKMPSGCWEWQGSRTPKGYGWIGAGASGVTVLVHRAVWESLHGPLPEGFVIMHTCDNPPCCRPEHLVAGTQRENIQDCIKKGRRRKK